MTRTRSTPVPNPGSASRTVAESNSIPETIDEDASTTSDVEEIQGTKLTEQALRSLSDAELDARLRVAEATKERAEKEKKLMALQNGEDPAALAARALTAVEPGPRIRVAEKKFTGHKKKFTGKSARELLTFLVSLEADHRYYHHYFTTDYDKIFNAVKCLEGTAETHWRSLNGDSDFENMQWDEFKDELKECLGDAATRDGDTYSRWMGATWKEGNNASVTYEYLRGLETLLPEEPTEEMLFYHFWNLTPVVYKERLSGAAKPKTRRSLVTAINQLYIDLGHNKRSHRGEDRNGKRNKSGDGKDSEKTVSNRKEQGNQAGKGNQGSSSSKETKPRTDVTCNYCEKPGHLMYDCRTKKYHEKNGTLKDGWKMGPKGFATKVQAVRTEKSSGKGPASAA
jgi:hypothetical protein